MNAETLSPITHNSIPVITTEFLARLYGSEVNSLKVNHSRHQDRFVEGKHYFKVAGNELEILRVTLSNSQNPVSPKTRSLILWTERGAARHAKMLETEKAWEVFERLEDCYFKKSDSCQPAEINNYQAVTIEGCAITQLNALFLCAEHLRTDMWPHLSKLIPGLDKDYKNTFETLAQAHGLLKKIREECRVKTQKIMGPRALEG